jgi:ABC-type sulfate/molybdate transport systems ATPase subunit
MALRMLAGILTPTTGRVSINGLMFRASPGFTKQTAFSIYISPH